MSWAWVLSNHTDIIGAHSAIPYPTIMQGPKRLTRNIPVIIATLSIFFVLCLVGNTRPAQKSESSSYLEAKQQGDASERPCIYRYKTSHEETTEEKKVFSIWESVWAAAGWTPLTLSVESIDMDHYGELQGDLSRAHLNQFQADQIWKYVALSSVGGGFLAHTDVFPLKIFMQKGSDLPNDGRLTIYDDMMSSLMSGRGSEWLWMARLLAKHALAYRGTDAWSEKIALQDLYSPDSLDVRKEMHHVGKERNSFRWDNNECSESQNRQAVHFELGGNELNHDLPNGSDMALKWLAEWIETCDEDSSSLIQNLSQTKELSATTRPLMYRFDPDVDATEEHLRRMRYAWTLTWENAGWKPMKLGVLDYTFVDDYADIREDLEKSGLSDRQQRHVWKYVSMSVVGGGFVAHGDTFPMHSFVQQGTYLPNEGRLTLYDDRSPCLLSGSAPEFLKVARLLAVHARTYSEKEPWTEAIALRQQWTFSDSVALQTEVLRVSDDLSKPSSEWSAAQCKQSSGKRAVHFAIDDLSSTGVPVENPVNRIIEWLGKWLDACEDSDHFQSNR